MNLNFTHQKSSSMPHIPARIMALATCLPLIAHPIEILDVVADYNADTTGAINASAAFDDALDDAIAANEDALIVVPPGTYLLTTRLYKAISSGADRTITIQGSGMGVSVIKVDNSDGFLELLQTGSTKIGLKLENLKITTVRNGQGTAVEFTKSIADTNSTCYFEALDMSVEGYDYTDDMAFAKGFHLDKVGKPSFNNVHIFGNHNEAKSNEEVYDSTFPMVRGVRVLDCHDTEFRGCYVKAAGIGIDVVVRNGFDPGSVSIREPMLVKCQKCVIIDNSSSYPTDVFIDYGHINYYDRGILLNNVNSATIDSMLFYCRDQMGSTRPGGDGGTARDYTPMDINASGTSNDILVRDCVFSEAANPQRISVLMSIDVSAMSVIGCLFDAEGTAMRNNSTSEALVSDHNYFEGRYFFGPDTRYMGDIDDNDFQQ